MRSADPRLDQGQQPRAFGRRRLEVEPRIERVDRQPQRLQHQERRLVDGIGRAVAVGQPRGAEAPHRETEEIAQGDERGFVGASPWRPRLADMNRRAFLFAGAGASPAAGTGRSAARAAGRIQVIYVGGWDCPYCTVWKNEYKKGWVDSPEYKQVAWIEVDVPHLREAYQERYWPGELAAMLRAAAEASRARRAS